ncbi:MAG: hypothetical protein JJE09_16055 [Bacteroidia bacterium]|nr:hypothetical protein [Bacteroidia bacterium]
MRLAQLARKLVIRPTVIVEFLINNNIQIEDGSNTRLEDEHVALIMQKFAPSRAAEVAAELAVEKEIEVESPIPETHEIDTPQELAESNTDISIIEPQVEIELIKAPKVELSGLKVLGKIELPEPKKKDLEIETESIEKEETATAEPEKKARQENRKPYPNRKESFEQRPRKNPIALERERDAIEAEKKKRTQLELEKEKRAQHYRKKVKVAPPTKSLKLVKEDVEEMALLEPVPKTLWGKFMKWLNT